ncbi:MAG TPA: cell filamentation protein Fic, partial [Firmicutes bacterium]|nr:cell filamentation protein Fic [Bacillota bacterium]
MTLENKLVITDSAELARVEEKISKAKALELFETGLLDAFEVGTFVGLSEMHK